MTSSSLNSSSLPSSSTQPSKTFNLWHGLLFLHGHIADPVLAGSLGQASTPRNVRGSRHNPFLSLRYLGGRPMHAGINFDLEEPLVDAPDEAVASLAAQRAADPETRGRATLPGTRESVAC